MRSVWAATVLASVILAGGAQAADIGDETVAAAQQYRAAPAPTRQFYIRADIGVARHKFSSFSQEDLTSNSGSFISESIGDSTAIGAGFGWQITRWLRADLTGDYLSTARGKGLDNLTATLTGPDGTLQANTLYDGSLSAQVGLLNGYVDFGKWRGVTPYIGAGIGASRIHISDVTTHTDATFTDATSGAVTTQVTAGTSADKDSLNLAWALMTGASFDISPTAKMDLGYRYLHLGGIASTSLLNCTCGSIGQPLNLNGLNDQQFLIGLRIPLGRPEEMQDHVPLK